MEERPNRWRLSSILSGDGNAAHLFLVFLWTQSILMRNLCPQQIQLSYFIGFYFYWLSNGPRGRCAFGASLTIYCAVNICVKLLKFNGRVAESLLYEWNYFENFLTTG